MNLKNGKVFSSKSVGTGPSSYEKRIYRAAVSKRLRNTDIYIVPEGCVYTNTGCKQNRNYNRDCRTKLKRRIEAARLNEVVLG